MYQADRGGYRKKDSLGAMFWSSCLGRLIIIAGILIVLCIICYITCPSEERMREQMMDNLRQHIEHTDSMQNDRLDDIIYNIGYIFSSAEGEMDRNKQESFNQLNRVEYYDHGIFSTIYLYNNFHVNGVRCGIGILGLVIPTIYSGDVVSNISPVRRDYNYKPLPDTGDEDYVESMPKFFGEEDYEIDPDFIEE